MRAGYGTDFTSILNKIDDNERIWDKRGEIDSVCFHQGYSPVTITRRVSAIVQDAGREEWGAEPLTLYYVIKLMKGGI